MILLNKTPVYLKSWLKTEARPDFKGLLSGVMRKGWLFSLFLLVLLSTLACSSGSKQENKATLSPYPEESSARISRGLVALSLDNNRIFLTWRLLPQDSPGTYFQVLRGEATGGSNSLEPLAKTRKTSYTDLDAVAGHEYRYVVRPLQQGSDGPASKEVRARAGQNGQPFLAFDIGEDYRYARVVAGDLNGDGELELIVCYSQDGGVDPYRKAWRPSTDTIKVAAFLRSGQLLWKRDLGRGIEVGGTYAPVVVWDLDGDGKAEVILKTNKSDNPLDYAAERVTVLNGSTGKIEREAKWPTITGHFQENYNNNSRNYIAIAHLDGKKPYIIVARGLYKTQVIWAYDNQLHLVWTRTLGRHIIDIRGNKWHRRMAKVRLLGFWKLLFRDRTTGSHSLPVVDINADGREEILWGEHCIGAQGKDLWVVKDQVPYVGHPDIVFAADILPSHPGKEVYYCREGWDGVQKSIGMLLVDNKGQTVWAKWNFTHIDRGWAARIIPGKRGMQCFGYDIKHKDWSTKGPEFVKPSTYLWDSDGTLLQHPAKSWITSFPVDWQGNGVRDVCTRDGELQRYDGTVVERFPVQPLWGGDLYGDHREELIVAPGVRKVYVYFSTRAMQELPKITRLADRQYRNDLSRTAMEFNDIPTESGFIAVSGTRDIHNN